MFGSILETFFNVLGGVFIEVPAVAAPYKWTLSTMPFGTIKRNQ